MSEKLQNPKTIQDQQHDFQNAVITVTKKAVKQLKIAMKSAGDENQILRMSVEGGGCSGMTYKMDFDKQQQEFDEKEELYEFQLKELILHPISFDLEKEMTNKYNLLSKATDIKASLSNASSILEDGDSAVH